MLTKFVGAIGVIVIVLTAGMLWVPSEASALYINFKANSIVCDEVLTGVSRGELNDDNVVCSVRIKEIFRGPCSNHGGNADPANGTPFQVPPDLGEVIDINLGTALPLSRQGKSFSQIEFTLAEIATYLGDLVDPEVLCPNGNWTVPFVVTKFDGIGEVLSGAASQPGGACTINPNTFNFDSCVATAGASACTQQECLRVSPCVKGTQNLILPDTYSCACVEHTVGGDPANKCVYGIK